MKGATCPIFTETRAFQALGKCCTNRAVNNALQRPKALEVGVGWKEGGRWRGAGKEELGARGLWGLKGAQNPDTQLEEGETAPKLQAEAPQVGEALGPFLRNPPICQPYKGTSLHRWRGPGVFLVLSTTVSTLFRCQSSGPQPWGAGQPETPDRAGAGGHAWGGAGTWVRGRFSKQL